MVLELQETARLEDFRCDGRQALVKVVQILVQDLQEQQNGGCVLGFAGDRQLLLSCMRYFEPSLQAAHHLGRVFDWLLA